MEVNKRSARILKYLKKHGDVFVDQSPFDDVDFQKLFKDQYVNRKNVSVPQGEGETPLVSTVYYINNRGRDALKSYKARLWISWVTLLGSIISAVIGIIQLFR